MQVTGELGFSPVHPFAFNRPAVGALDAHLAPPADGRLQAISLVGLLDYLPSRWARLAADTTVDDIELGVSQLETSPSHFVVVDRQTDELLVRTLVKHDVSRTLTNRNLLQGLWRAWATISSRQLRLAAVR